MQDASIHSGLVNLGFEKDDYVIFVQVTALPTYKQNTDLARWNHAC